MRHAGAVPVAERQREVERNIFPGAGAAVAVIKALQARAQAQRSPRAGIKRLIVVRRVVVAVIAAVVVIADAERAQL